MRLVTNTLSLDVIFHNATISHHITPALLPDKRLNSSLHIPTTRKPSLMTSWIQWVCQFYLCFFGPPWSKIPLQLCSQPMVCNGYDFGGVISLLQILILPQVLDLALSPTFSLICEVANMCCPIIKSIKNVCRIEDSGTTFIWIFYDIYLGTSLSHLIKEPWMFVSDQS